MRIRSVGAEFYVNRKSWRVDGQTWGSWYLLFTILWTHLKIRVRLLVDLIVMYNLLFLLKGMSQKKGKYKLFLLERQSRIIIDFFLFQKLNRLSKNFYRMSCLMCFKLCKYEKCSCWENIFRKITILVHVNRKAQGAQLKHTHTQNSLFFHGDYLLLDCHKSEDLSISMAIALVNHQHCWLRSRSLLLTLHHRNGFDLHCMILSVWLPVIYNKVVLI